MDIVVIVSGSQVSVQYGGTNQEIRVAVKNYDAVEGLMVSDVNEHPWLVEDIDGIMYEGYMLFGSHQPEQVHEAFSEIANSGCNEPDGGDPSQQLNNYERNC